MEGSAIAQVGYTNRVPILIVRALSDLAGGQSGVNQEERNSQLAASNAAEVTAKILERIDSAQEETEPYGVKKIPNWQAAWLPGANGTVNRDGSCDPGPGLSFP